MLPEVVTNEGNSFGRWIAAILLVAGTVAVANDRDDVQGRWLVVSRWAHNARQFVGQREVDFAVDTLQLLGSEGAFILDESQRPKRMRHVLARPGIEDPITIHL